ncbi:MAG: hypothetical protein MjAS7_1953 [Metallosphaera javensis (ex Sakai et al. 2022)]|nr:MAG: hypothetical protein MjAS7_1953 [Metallosphaera javensis (ex Sakai et al. 2022)]
MPPSVSSATYPFSLFKLIIQNAYYPGKKLFKGRGTDVKFREMLQVVGYTGTGPAGSETATKFSVHW